MMVVSGSMTSGKRGMGSEEGGATSIDEAGPGGSNRTDGEVADVESPPKFKSTGDVRRTLLVLLPANNLPGDSFEWSRLPANILLPLLDRWPAPDEDRQGKSRLRNLDPFPPPENEKTSFSFHFGISLIINTPWYLIGTEPSMALILKFSHIITLSSS